MIYFKHSSVVVFLILGAFLFNVAFGVNEYGPQPKESFEKKNTEEINYNPSDVASVSQFIKDFQRKIDDVSLTVGKSDLTLLKDYTTEFSYPDYHKQTENLNLTAVTVHSNNTAKNVTTLVKCNTDTTQSFLSVELVNSTRLLTLLAGDPNVTSRHMPAQCLVLLFYARSCPFSCLAAPHFNALARAFPNVKAVAINALTHQSFNTQFGIGGVPTVMLFHNGRPAAKFNESEYTLEMFSRFITRFTGLKPVERMFVTSGDFGGPVPSVLAKETDYLLALSWLVVLFALGVLVSKSHRWKALVEIVQNAWWEAQAQHDHVD